VTAALVAGGWLLAAPVAVQADWTIGAYLGGAHTLRSALEVQQPEVLSGLRCEDVSWESRSLDQPLYYGLRAGYVSRQRRWLGLEAEFVHLKVYARPEDEVATRGTWHSAPVDGRQPLGDFVQEFAVSHGANFLLVNGVVRRPWRTAGGWPRWDVALRCGAGPTLLHPESTVEGAHRERYEWGGLGLQFALGVEGRFANGLTVFAEGKWTHAAPSVAIAAGEARTTLDTFHIVFGTGWRL
jgi:hypothetical protein